MQANAKKAYDQLKAINAPIVERETIWEENNAHFCISGEHNGDDIWADFWDPEFGEYGISMKIIHILVKHKLFAEWVNPGLLAIYDI